MHPEVACRNSGNLLKFKITLLNINFADFSNDHFQALFGSIGSRFAIGKNSVSILHQVRSKTNKHFQTETIKLNRKQNLAFFGNVTKR
jgi:hypothetical protein